MKESLSKHKVPFTQVANSVLCDKNLSWKAKGLFGYIYSKPDGWDFHGDRITKDGKDKRDSVFSGIKELEEAGYLSRERLPNGRMKYRISYSPIKSSEAKPDGKPLAEKASWGKSPRGKIRKISKTEEESNIVEESNIYIIGEKTKKFVFEVKQSLAGTSLKRQQVERLRDFVSYWTEPNKSQTKIRWELQPTWDMKRRLATWFRRDQEFQGRKAGVNSKNGGIYDI